MVRKDSLIFFQMTIGQNVILDVGQLGHIHAQTVFMCLLVFAMILGLRTIFTRLTNRTSDEIFFQFINDLCQAQESGIE